MSTEDLITIHGALKTLESFTTPENMPKIVSARNEVQELLGWGPCRDCGKEWWVIHERSRYCAYCRKTHGI